jgi:predicted nucleic acid-binding protein
VAVVVDASAVALVLLEEVPEAVALRRRLGEEPCDAPHLIDVELGSALRRHVRAGRLDASDARDRLALGVSLVDHRYELTDRLLDAAWGLRDILSFYDATYVALAYSLALPLLTADARLARAPGLPCAVELVAM